MCGLEPHLHVDAHANGGMDRRRNPGGDNCSGIRGGLESAFNEGEC